MHNTIPIYTRGRKVAFVSGRQMFVTAPGDSIAVHLDRSAVHRALDMGAVEMVAVLDDWRAFRAPLTSVLQGGFPFWRDRRRQLLVMLDDLTPAHLEVVQ